MINKLLKDKTIKTVYNILPRGKKSPVIKDLIGFEGDIELMIKNFNDSICDKEFVKKILKEHGLDSKKYLNPITKHCKSLVIEEDNLLKNEVELMKKEAKAIGKSIKEKTIEPLKEVYKEEEELLKDEIDTMMDEVSRINKTLEEKNREVEEEYKAFLKATKEIYDKIEEKLRKFLKFKNEEDAKKEFDKEYNDFKKKH